MFKIYRAHKYEESTNESSKPAAHQNNVRTFRKKTSAISSSISRTHPSQYTSVTQINRTKNTRVNPCNSLHTHIYPRVWRCTRGGPIVARKSYLTVAASRAIFDDFREWKPAGSGSFVLHYIYIIHVCVYVCASISLPIIIEAIHTYMCACI